jgi:hypothetical protein
VRVRNRSAKNVIIRNFTIWLVIKRYHNVQIREDGINGLINTQRRHEKFKAILVENLKRRNHFKKLSLDGSIILKWTYTNRILSRI